MELMSSNIEKKKLDENFRHVTFMGQYDKLLSSSRPLE